MAENSQPDPSQVARKVELIVAQLDSLPTLPRIATQLLRLTRSDKASTHQITELIKQDQAVTAKVLSLAHRAGSGIRGEATTIDKCVLLMGLEAVRSAALSIKIFEIFDPASDTASGPFDLAGFWKHSLAVALACERLAARPPQSRTGSAGRERPAPDELFVAGLLHDIGKAALHHCLPKSYCKVIEAAESSHSPLLALERRLIGVDHTVIGKRLAQRWSLPQGVVESIWLHHSPPPAMPESVRQRGFAPVVFLADLIVRELRLGYSGNYPRLMTSGNVAASLGFPAELLEQLRRSLPEELTRRASLIGMDQLDSRDLYYDALTGVNKELVRLNAKLLTRSASLATKAKYFDLIGDLNREHRAGARPIEVAEQIGRLFGPLTGGSRLLVFSEPPTAPGGSQADPLIEGAAFNPSQPDEPERFLLQPLPGDVEGLAAARRAGWFDPAQSAEGFALYPLEGHLSWVHHHLTFSLPLENCYLLPLVAQGVWVGAVIFSSEGGAEPLKSWPTCRPELFALASAAGSVLRTSQVTAGAERVAEELAQTGESCARLQDELSRERELASVGQMAAGTGHELNNPLTVISGRSELLAAEEPDPNRREALEQIRQNAERASAIITEMMSFASPPPAEPEQLSLAELAGRLAEPLKQSGIEVTVQADPDAPPAWADTEQLQEAIQKILDNAQQAMAAQDANRRLTVHVALPALPGAGRPDRAGQRELELVITDTGVGMEPFVLEHATDPFFSARPAGRGRGLGLARARRLIEHNGGLLRLESQPGAGTTVRINVPVAGDEEHPEDD